MFTKDGGKIVYVNDTDGNYTVNASGAISGARKITEFDRTANTYGMEAWVFVGDDTEAEVFSRPVAAP